MVKVGGKITLQVIRNPKTGEPAFKAVFSERRHHPRRMFVFWPDEQPTELGEYWEVQINTLEYSGKRTRDRRAIMHSDVTVLRRIERIEEYMDQAGQVYVRAMYCGSSLVNIEHIPATVQTRYCKTEEDTVYPYFLITGGGRLLDFVGGAPVSKGDYLKFLQKQLAGFRELYPLNLAICNFQAIPVFSPLPNLPEAYKAAFC